LSYRAHDYWFWVPVIGQFIGGIFGAIAYIITIELHHPVVEQDAELEMQGLTVAVEDEQTGLLKSTEVKAAETE